MAFANGCSEPCSKSAAMDKHLFLSFFCVTTIFFRMGLPVVSVPVLSKASIFIWLSSSIADIRIGSTWYSVNRAAPKDNATGAAKAKAQGQVTMSTEIILLSASGEP